MEILVAAMVFTCLSWSVEGRLLQGSYEDGQHLCEGMNKHLPTRSELNKALAAKGWWFPHTPFWVALTRQELDNWQTLNGSFYAESINLRPTEGENCAVYLVLDDKIGEQLCNRVIGGYVCLKQEGVCPHDATCMEDYAFHKLDNATWYTGYDQCLRRGTEMAALPLSSKQLASFGQGLGGRGHYAIGVSKSMFYEQRKGLTGLPINYNWDKNNPYPQHRCAVVYGDKLRSQDCGNTSVFFICVPLQDTNPSKKTTKTSGRTKDIPSTTEKPISQKLETVTSSTMLRIPQVETNSNRDLYTIVLLVALVVIIGLYVILWTLNKCIGLEKLRKIILRKIHSPSTKTNVPHAETCSDDAGENVSIDAQDDEHGSLIDLRVQAREEEPVDMRRERRRAGVQRDVTALCHSGNEVTEHQEEGDREDKV